MAYERLGMMQCGDCPHAEKFDKTLLYEVATVWNQLGGVFDELFALADDATRMRETLIDLQQAAVDVLASTTSRIEDADEYWQGRLDAIEKE